MKIICHRGHWSNYKDQNSLKSIKRALDFDGVEVDVRSLNGDLVLSHDPVNSGLKYTLIEDAFKLKAGKEFFWALNIKEDGLGEKLKKLIKKYKITNYMCFDLSFPEGVCFEKIGLKIFERTGDREPEISQKDLVFDCFDSNNFKRTFRRIPSTARVMIISPELHGHKFQSAWSILKNSRVKELYLCTDFPEKAREYFVTC